MNLIKKKGKFYLQDSKVKDYQKADVQKIADYLWSWSNNDPFGWEARYIIKEGLNKSNLTEANLQKGIKNAEKELDRVYAQLKQRVQQMLEAGYKGQKERIYKYADVLRKEDAYVKDSKVKDKDWADYLRDVLDDENIDYNGIGSDYATFDNEDDMEDAIFILERQEGRKLRIDKKKLEIKILR